jgi:ABC-type branched-subunit amino acid transport system permease subunit
MAALAGVLLALWLRYTGPDTTLSFTIMIDVLLMVVIGGMGTLYGAVIGATLMIIAENYLQVLMGRRGSGIRRAGALGCFRPTAGWGAVCAQRLFLPGGGRGETASTGKPAPLIAQVAVLSLR